MRCFEIRDAPQDMEPFDEKVLRARRRADTNGEKRGREDKTMRGRMERKREGWRECRESVQESGSKVTVGGMQGK